VFRLASPRMRIAVTGGAGFIGSHLADALLDQGHQVLVVDDLSTGRRDNVPAGATFAEVDIRDGEALSKAFAGFRPDVVSHQAAQTSVSVSTREPVRDAEVNVVGTIRLLEACVDHSVSRIVFASTAGAIYDVVPEGERAEVGRPMEPLSPYACSKLSGESYLRCWESEHLLPHTILRYANVYGPRQDPHGEAGVVAIFMRRLLEGRPIAIFARSGEGDAGCVRDYVYVGDVVRANLRALAGELTAPIVNVCTGEATTTLELSARIERALGVDVEPGFGPRRPGDLERSVLEPDPDVLPSTVTLDDGLRATAEWFRRRPG